MKMKTRPILFSGEMVRAILAGQKTQTRRVVRPDVASCCTHQCGGTSQAVLSRCPYGQPGDGLWVKETHLPKASGCWYRADMTPMQAAGIGGMYGGWKPSIFMPRKLSRISLVVKGVRVERLQSITHCDAKAEGVEQGKSDVPGNYRAAYERLWESINGQGSWAVNPWVWVIEFEVTELR